jgi:four helix bundle protein
MVATGNVVRDKSYVFALSVVKTVRRLRAREREFELSGQLVRAATSIGANVEEAIAGQSRRDFAAKMAIASKEARETKYWLRLMADAEMLNVDGSHRLLEQCEELVRILTSIVKTAQQRT